MLRFLALPVALAAVLASTGCAIVDGGGATAGPDASASESGTVAPGAPASGDAGSAEPEPSASDDQEASDAPPSIDASDSDAPETLSSTPVPEGDPGVPGIPDQSGASVDDVLRLGAVASWSEQPRRIALSLPASGSCWSFAGQAVVESPTRIVVRVEQPQQQCDALDGARTYVITVPAGIDATADLQLAVVGLEHEFTLTLPAG